MKELFWDLLTRFLINLKCFLFSEATFGVRHYSHNSCHLISNLIFLFFWSIPSDFKSSFKLRKGHFPQFSSEKLPSPTERHSPGVKHSHARTSGPIGKSLWALVLDDPIYHKPETAQSLQKVAFLCTRHFLKGEGSMEGLKFDHQKSAQ